MLDREMLEKVLKHALGSGGDYADVFVEDSSPTHIVLEDDRIEKVVSGSSRGVGLRVLFGGKTAFAISNELSQKALMELASSLARAVRGGEQGMVNEIGKARSAVVSPVMMPPAGTPLQKKADLLIEANRIARGRHGSIRQVSAIYRDTVQKIQVAASTGEHAMDERVITTGIVNVVAERDGQVQTGYEPVSGTTGFELFDMEPLVAAAERASDIANALLGARRAPGGRMPVVIASEAGGTMIHEAIGHGLEADLALEGLSKFSGMMGNPVASPLISVIDDPTLKGRRGSYAFDDEGVRSKRNVLVEKGVLKGYMHDRLSAMKGKMEPTGNGRRESYRHRPVPRMSNTFIAPGRSAPEEVLGSVDRGLLVRRMGGGQVNTVNGDFVFDVAEGYIIEKGRAGELVRGATLTGNGPEILMSIDMVGSDLGFAIGTCGKDGQGVPVSDAMPTLRIPDIVVGGET